ncbi:hypothetical protein FKO01_03215 [Mesorhizobium sp. B2-3-3]|nr:hypothetical protein FKO01_03215 [Mesorhizobium sp. B2-3-3]
MGKRYSDSLADCRAMVRAGTEGGHRPPSSWRALPRSICRPGSPSLRAIPGKVRSGFPSGIA